MSMRGWLLAWLPVIGYCVLMFALSSVPGPKLPKPLFWHSDKVIHAVEYGILGVLLLRALHHTFPDISHRRLVLYAVLLAVLYALSDEFHQSYVPRRSSSLLDVVADTVGACIACVSWGSLTIKDTDNSDGDRSTATRRG